MQFLLEFASVSTEIFNLLNLQIIDRIGNFEGNRSSKTYLAQQLKWALVLNNNGEIVERNSQLMKVRFLSKHLHEIKNHNSEIFNQFKRDIKKCMKAAEFYGLRMEIYTAASLTRSNVEFIKRESPDFEIRINNEKCFIECSSVHFQGGEGNPADKIIGAIRKKSKKPYANFNTALFIDITNTLCNARQGIEQNIDLRKLILDEISKDSYGCVILFAYKIYDHGNGIDCQYICVNPEHISKNLLNYVSTNFPIVGVERKEYWLPDQV